MGHRKKHAPRHGSLAFLPRKRAVQMKGRVRNWIDGLDEVKFLGFAGFKAGMTHITYIEDQKNSPYYGKELMKPVTVIEVPPLILIGIRVYNEDEYGKYIIAELYTNEFNNYLSRKINLPNLEKKASKDTKKEILKILNETSEIRGIFQTQPNKTSIPRKKPDIIEIKGYIAKGINNITTYEACTNCFKKVDNCTCGVREKTEYRMIINLVIDDGTGTIRTTFMGEKAEKLIGIKTEKIVQIKDTPDFEKILEKKSSELLGKDIIIRGRAKFSDYSNSYEISIYDFKNINIDEELEKVMKEIEL